MIHTNLKSINLPEIIYVSHPEHYNIKYKINSWMNLDTKVDNNKAIDQTGITATTSNSNLMKITKN